MGEQCCNVDKGSEACPSIRIAEPSWEVLTPLDGERILKSIESVGRTCYQSARNTTEDSCYRFVKMLIERGHEAMIEHEIVTVRFNVDRAIQNELVRHRLSSFCVSGNTEVFAFAKKNPKTAGQFPCKSWKIKDLFLWQTDPKRKGRLKLINLRSVDDRGVIVPNHIVQIFHNGVQDVYKVRTVSGRELLCTREHQIMTVDGFKPLEDLSVGDFIYTNGRELLENEEWIRKTYLVENHTRKEVARLAECSETLVYKAFKRFGIFKPWSDRPNRKGGPGRKKGSMSSEEMKNLRLRVSGQNSNWWISDRSKLKSSGGYAWTHRLYDDKRECCFGCGSKDSLEIHHIDKNPANPSTENIRILCTACHKTYHHPKKLAIVRDEIASIEFAGSEDVYDIQMESPHHNYIANGFVVHNSVESTRFVNYSLEKNGHSISVILPPGIKKGTCEYDLWVKAMQTSSDMYFELLKTERPEIARSVLPLALKTEIVMTANLRQWRNVFRLRCDRAAHPQMRQVMLPLLSYLKKQIPVVFDDLDYPEELEPSTV